MMRKTTAAFTLFIIILMPSSHISQVELWDSEKSSTEFVQTNNVSSMTPVTPTSQNFELFTIQIDASQGQASSIGILDSLAEYSKLCFMIHGDFSCELFLKSDLESFSARPSPYHSTYITENQSLEGVLWVNEGRVDADLVTKDGLRVIITSMDGQLSFQTYDIMIPEELQPRSLDVNENGVYNLRSKLMRISLILDDSTIQHYSAIRQVLEYTSVIFQREFNVTLDIVSLDYLSQNSRTSVPRLTDCNSSNHGLIDWVKNESKMDYTNKWNRGLLSDASIYVTNSNYFVWKQTIGCQSDSSSSFPSSIWVKYNHANQPEFQWAMTHELAHSLNADHDGPNECMSSLTNDNVTGHIMCPIYNGALNLNRFSNQTRLQVMSNFSYQSQPHLQWERSLLVNPAPKSDLRGAKVDYVIADQMRHAILNCSVLFQYRFNLRQTIHVNHAIAEIFSAIRSSVNRSDGSYVWDYWMGYDRFPVPGTSLYPGEEYNFRRGFLNHQILNNCPTYSSLPDPNYHVQHPTNVQGVTWTIWPVYSVWNTANQGVIYHNHYDHSYRFQTI